MPLGIDQQVDSIIWSPLAAGRLGGRYRRNNPMPQDGRVARGGAPVRDNVVAYDRLYNIIDVLDEVAAETGLTAEEIASAELAAAAPESLQQENADGLTLESLLGSEDPEGKMLQSIDLRQAVEALPDKERTVIALRYFRACTQQECARILKVSQVQVSRLEKRALQKLRLSVGAGD